MKGESIYGPFWAIVFGGGNEAKYGFTYIAGNGVGAYYGGHAVGSGFGESEDAVEVIE
jgi:hypothetical protein